MSCDATWDGPDVWDDTEMKIKTKTTTTIIKEGPSLPRAACCVSGTSLPDEGFQDAGGIRTLDALVQTAFCSH